ncbi:hypothetical protein [Paucidesulfovibrio longus]|uniref:hypothetical protein n=1 Tax=Paucidesulfovibrio longus TaxID=889 RepID=UPI0003B35EAE|nr:hypothetical protein [Paucidesulfovibrio longus]
MDGYKKIIVFGCLLLAGGYFLPWTLAQGEPQTGFSLVAEGFSTLRPMYEAGIYDQSYVLDFAALALPGLAAILAFLYCMVKPLNRNGSLATLVFLLPALTLAAVHGYLFAAEGSASHPLLRELYGSLHTMVFDLRQTGGLWLVHFGALLMFLGRATRRPAQRGGLR